jgi:hypothetical protein
VNDVIEVIEKNKRSLYATYNAAVRQNPKLVGEVVFTFTIAPSGEVIDCSVTSSTLLDVTLENNLVARLRQLNFGAKDVEPMAVTFLWSSCQNRPNPSVKGTKCGKPYFAPYLER